MICDRSDKAIKPINIFQFVDMLLNWKFIETAVLMTGKEQPTNRDSGIEAMPAFHKTTEEEKYAICEWKYDGEYAVYNPIPYNEQIKLNRGFADPKNNYYSFSIETTLIGYLT